MEPLVIAHRGDSAHAPESTLEAFQLAIANGADSIETDLRLSADGTVVAFHDDVLDRLTSLSGPVVDQDLAALARLWVLPQRFAPRDDRRICTLDQILQGPGSELPFYLELKASGNLALDQRLVSAVLASVPENSPHVLASFDVSLVRKSMDAARTTVQIANRFEDVDRSLLPALHAVSLRHNNVRSDAIDTCLAAGTPVWTWTVDEPSRARELVDMGVSGVCTNDVAIIRDAIRGQR